MEKKLTIEESRQSDGSFIVTAICNDEVISKCIGSTRTIALRNLLDELASKANTLTELINLAIVKL